MQYMHNIILPVFLLVSLSLHINAQNITEDHAPTSKPQYFLNEEIYKIRSGKDGASRLKSLQTTENYNIKEDSILIEINLTNHQHHRGIIQQMNQQGARLNKIISDYDYYGGYVQIDQLLTWPEIYPIPDLHVTLTRMELDHDNQGPTLMNSATYETNAASPNAGQGITIAIIDCSWEGYNSLISSGVVPGSFTFRDCSSGSCTSSSTTIPTSIAGLSTRSDHGTNVTQIAFDHAPASTYLLYKSCGTLGRAAAINDAINRNVNIIICSESGYNTGWSDDSGPLCAAVNQASAQNILMFFSSGNRNGGWHYQGSFKDSDNDNFHEWSGDDELNNMTLNVNQRVRYLMQWDSDSDDYELRLYTENSVLLGTWDSSDEFEEASYTNISTSPLSVRWAVKSKTGNTPDFEIIARSNDSPTLQHASNGNQTTSPANSSNPNVFAIAAVNQQDYEDDIVMARASSSVGPTNDNNRSVDLTGPTLNTVTDVNLLGNRFLTTFGGTSCATPNVGGAAAALWSKHPNLSATGIRALLLDMAQDYKDWPDQTQGDGYDHTFGYGGVYLYDYDPDNIFINEIEHMFNIPYTPTLPFSTMQQVDLESAPHKKAIFLGENHVIPSRVITKPMVYKSAKKTVVLR